MTTEPIWSTPRPPSYSSRATKAPPACRFSNGCPTARICACRHCLPSTARRGRGGLDAHEGALAAHAPPFQIYGLGLKHKHVPEIQQQAGLAQAPVFVPSYGHYRQGIVLTIGLHLRLLHGGVTAEHLHAALQQHHAGHACIDVRPWVEDADALRLEPQTLNGSDRMQLSVFAQPQTGQVLLAAVLDNLGKGAAGAAVQNLALMLGQSALPGWQPEARAV